MQGVGAGALGVLRFDIAHVAEKTNWNGRALRELREVWRGCNQPEILI